MKQLIHSIHIKRNLLINKLGSLGEKALKYSFIAKSYHYFSDTSSFRKVLRLSLLLTFLFYLPFTIYVLFFDGVLFFQLDHLYQYSTLVFDLQNRVFTGNFSTWDWKNAMGYDYFANFYYIPLDFSLLPFFLFPFLAYHQLMWLSFILKILVGTALFTYLLKLYRLSNKTILFAAFIYGTADLFLAQNVFPSFVGLIVYIPLLLIAIEYILQKKNYLLFSLVIFQMFLFNFYWSWPLSLFMAITLFIRLLYQNEDFVTTMKILMKSIFFYLLGLGLASFFLLPILAIMQAEPRMGTFSFNFKTFFTFNQMVYYKTFFKMLVPNLFAYRGYFYDKTDSYYLPTNHIIIYSSILASFSVVQFLLHPSLLLKRQLNNQNYKTYQFLKYTTLITTICLFIPVISFLFSATTTAYLRWFIFYGVLLIINFAFLYEHKLIQYKYLFPFLILSILFLRFANAFNDRPEVYSKHFHLTDQMNSITMMNTYLISILILFVLFKSKITLPAIIITEKIALILLMTSLLIQPSYTSGVRHHSIYGKEMNELLKQSDDPYAYGMTHHFLYYDDTGDQHPLNNTAYLNQYGVYGSGGTFHSLINPYYSYYHETNHRRLYKVSNMPYFYYSYMDPTRWIVSQDQDSFIQNAYQHPESQLVASKVIDEFHSNLSLYQKEPDLALGVGFNQIFNSTNKTYYNYMWLQGLYVEDEELMESLLDDFTEIKGNNKQLTLLHPEKESIPKNTPSPSPYDLFPSLYFSRHKINGNQEEAEVIYARYSTSYEMIKVLLLVDQNDDVTRCYNGFCQIPESGVKEIIVGTTSDTSSKQVNLYTVDQEAVEANKQDLMTNSTYYVNINGNKIETKVKNDQPVIMNYKIGYAPGWTVTVDGEEVETFPAHGGLLSFKLMEPGDHEINLNYETPYLNTGIKISLISFILLTFIALISFNKKKILLLMNKVNKKINISNKGL
jgi:Bacterial membrane protein YfhO